MPNFFDTVVEFTGQGSCPLDTEKFCSYAFKVSSETYEARVGVEYFATSSALLAASTVSTCLL